MNQKAAITILLTVVILTVILMISLAAAGLVTAQLKMARLAGDSLKAFYAADAGAEKALYETRKEGFCSTGTCYLPGPTENDFSILDNGASFRVKLIANDKQASSTGRFKNSNRAIKVYWE